MELVGEKSETRLQRTMLRRLLAAQLALALAEPPAGTDEEQKNCGHVSLGKSAEHRIWMCAGASDKDLHTLIKEEMKRDAYWPAAAPLGHAGHRIGHWRPRGHYSSHYP